MFTNAPRPYSTPTTKIILIPQYLADLPPCTLSSYFTLKTPPATPCSCTGCPNCSHSPSPCVFHDSHASSKVLKCPLPSGGMAAPQEHIPKGKGQGTRRDMDPGLWISGKGVTLPADSGKQFLGEAALPEK